MTTANDILKVARAEIGYKESPANSNRTKYNIWYYGKDTAAAWCAIFVDWVFGQCNAISLLPGGVKDAYVPTIADKIIASGRSVGKANGQPGDIVTFDWEQNKSSDHVGIIEKKNSDGSYTTIEGNTGVGNDSNGGEVMRRTRYQSQISYIFRPAYSGTSTAPSTGTSSSKLTLDGKWGKNTTKMTQKVLGTTQDGIVSGQLKSCKPYCLNMLAESWQWNNGSGSPMVKAIQKLLGVTQDGQMGPDTIKAMQKMLKSKGWYTGPIDGYAGWKTVDGWQRYINSRL